MTNFEWLVKSGELARYISGWFIQMNPQRDGHTNFAIECAKYLQAEHKEPKKRKYVALDDVIEILRMPRKLNIKNTNCKVDMPSILEMESKHYFDMQKALFNLETKEIDE